jgi:DNA ligase D-like protein (predicted 3'-phosphoesterase)
MEGVLKSWAVPKQLPVKSGIKRLAIQVEDHALGYIDFKGTIPEGQYGAGTVKIWDKGTYLLKERTKDKIEAVFKGKKLKGAYALVRFRKSGRKNWLLMKLRN